MIEDTHGTERRRACRGPDGAGPGEYHTIREPEGPAFTIPGARRGAGEAREVTAGPGEYHGCGLHASGTAWTMGHKPRARVRLPPFACRRRRSGAMQRLRHARGGDGLELRSRTSCGRKPHRGLLLDDLVLRCARCALVRASGVWL